MHLAIIGTGRVGRMTLMALLSECWLTKLTLIDTKPGLAGAVEEEARHALASARNKIELESHERDDKVENADIILITAGTPRTPKMDSRTDLKKLNADIIKDIGENVVPKNPQARYVVVTNPVDAMATLFKKITGANWVISTGTNLESQRFRAELAKILDVPITSVRGFVGGEHGKKAVFLWSTARVEGKELDAYLEENGIEINREKIENNVKNISKEIIDSSGGTRHGPGASFRDILRSIAINNNRVLSIATRLQFTNIPDDVMISIPQMVGRSCGPTFKRFLSHEEWKEIGRASERVLQTYSEARRKINTD